jgi:phage terminase large subunit-like protein
MTTKTKDKELLLTLLAAKDNDLKYRKFYTYFYQDHMIDPVTNLDISRDKYTGILKFFAAGADFKERILVAPNRVGKTEAGTFEMTCHLTKDYPSWWKGKRFGNKTCLFAFVGKTNEAARNVAQGKLLGSIRNPGTGMVPNKQYNNGVGIDEKSFTRKTGIAETVMDLYVTDIYGNENKIIFFSMAQEPEAIEGMTLDGVWFDENKLDAKGWYNEAFARTITTNGILLSTFTPWPDGYTETVSRFIPNRVMPEDGICRDADGQALERFAIGLDLVSCPHMTDEQKATQAAAYSGNEYEARVLGKVPLGQGAVYPIPIDDITVPFFQIPQGWPKAYGLDFGWTETAVVWVAEDPNTRIRYVYAEYHKGGVTPFVHAEAIRQRDEWLTGSADPSGAQSNAMDGRKFIDEYRKLGLNLEPGKNNLATGIASLQIQFESGRLKIFNTCQHILDEYSKYRYDDHGKPARNQDDHCLDALRYVDSIFESVCKSELEWMKEEAGFYDLDNSYSSTRDSWSGY